MKLFWIMYVGNTKSGQVASNEKRQVSGGVVMACVLGETTRSCVTALKAGTEPQSRPEGWRGSAVAWELLQEPGLSRQHGRSLNTEPWPGMAARDSVRCLYVDVGTVSRGREGVISVQGVRRPVLHRNVADKLEGVRGGP